MKVELKKDQVIRIFNIWFYETTYTYKGKKYMDANVSEEELQDVIEGSKFLKTTFEDVVDMILNRAENNE